MTTNPLPNWGICGRQKERAILEACYDRVATNRTVERVSVQGVGKHRLLKEVWANHSGAVGWGSFVSDGDVANNEPIRAVVACVESLVHALWKIDAEGWQTRIGKIVRRSELRPLGLYSAFLSTLVDGTPNNIDHDDGQSTTDDESVFSWSTANSRQLRGENRSLDLCRLALRALIRCLCACHNEPIVLIFMNVHRADTMSQLAVQTLWKDRRAQNLLLVTTSSEPTESSLLSPSTQNPAYTVLKLDHLTTEEIRTWVKTWSNNSDRAEMLASWLYECTNGDPRNLTAMLSNLQHNNILIQNNDSASWNCDTSRLDEVEVGSVDKEMVNAYSSLAPPVQVALTHAACLNQETFALSLLQTTLQNPHELSKDPFDVTELEQSLDSAVEANLLVRSSPTHAKYQFAQSRWAARIRESFLPAGTTLEALHQKMGENLLLASEANKDDDVRKRNQLLLQAVHQLNMGTKQDVSRLAELNLQAATICIDRAFFYSASIYCRAGLDCLPRIARWSDHYDVALQLSVLLGQALYTLGNVSECETTMRSVLLHSKTLDDETKAYDMLIRCLVAQQRGQEAVRTVKEVLEKTGIKVPPSYRLKYTILRQLLAIHNTVKRRGLDSLASLPVVHDKLLEIRISFFHLLGEVGILIADADMQAFAFTSVGLQTLRHGALSTVSIDLTVIATLFAMLGNHDAAAKIYDIARLSMDDSTPVFYRVRSTLLGTFFVEHWRYPLTSCLEKAVEYRDMILEDGLVDELFYSSMMYGFFYFHNGLPLSPLEKDMQKAEEMLVDLGFFTTSSLIQPFLQFLQNLLGKSDDPTILTGDTMNQKDSLRISRKTNNIRSHQTIQMFRMISCFLFNDVKHGLKLSDEMLPAIEEGPSPMLRTRIAFQALLCFAMAHESGKFWYAKKGRTFLHRLEKMQRRGCPNVYHYVALIHAEDCAFTNRKRKDTTGIRRMYDKAIVASGRLGILHIQAIANERAGLFLLGKSETTLASDYLSQAWSLYNEWGALAKCRRMELRHAEIINKEDSSQEKGISHRGRERLDLSKMLHNSKSSSLEMY